MKILYLNVIVHQLVEHTAVGKKNMVNTILKPNSYQFF